MKVFLYDQVDWANLFAPQTGGSRFRGYPYQRGGSIPSLFRAAVRIVPSFLNSPVGKELVTGVLGTAHDIRRGASPLTAIKTHGREVIRRLAGVGKRGQIVKKESTHQKPVIRKKPTSRKRPLFVPAL